MRLVAIAVALVVGLSLAACHAGDPAVGNLKAAQGFLTLNGKQPGVITLPTGLEYKVVRSGPADGTHPGPGDEMKVNYEGKLLNGMVFDSSFARGEPADLPLAGLVPAWMQALPMMRPGDEWILYVPPSLGYADHGAVGIPPNSLLIFRIQLLGVLQHSPAMG
jgi:peptidylprolyl isomerase/FKBP-type peptidyl-prolyl cis-trans isomerase FklB